jgi:hypothetical protein
VYVQIPGLNLGPKTANLVKVLVIYFSFYFQEGREDFHLILFKFIIYVHASIQQNAFSTAEKHC